MVACYPWLDRRIARLPNQMLGYRAKAPTRPNPDQAGIPSHFALIECAGFRYYRLSNVIEGLSKRRYLAPFDIGLIYIGLGDNAQTLEWLQGASKDRPLWFVWIKSTRGLTACAGSRASRTCCGVPDLGHDRPDYLPLSRR
jgi:hypothetical protein